MRALGDGEELVKQPLMLEWRVALGWACVAGSRLVFPRPSSGGFFHACLVSHSVSDFLVLRRLADYHWEVLDEWEPLLFGPEGLRLDQWRTEGRVEVVKHGDHRTVYRVQLPGTAVYIKQYRCPRIADIARHLLLPSRARREWQRTSQAARRGIPVARPLGWVERVAQGLVRDSYFISQEIPDACTLDEWLRERKPAEPAEPLTRQRSEMAVELARFVASAHQTGLVQHDLHLGNILVENGRQSDGGGRRFALKFIDLARASLMSPLNWRKSLANLVPLHAACWERTSRWERMRFWRAYLAARPELFVLDQRRALEWLEAATRRHSSSLQRDRDKRSLRVNRDYVGIHGDQGSAYGIRGLPKDDLARLLSNPEQLLWRNLERPVKLGHSSLAVEAEIEVDGRPTRVLYKRFRARSGLRGLLAQMCGTRAVRAWYSGHALLERNIPTARPVAACEISLPGRRRQGYLATEWIEGAENLHLFGWRLASRPPKERFRRAAECAESLGEMLGRMHSRQIVHGDLKGGNLLVVDRNQQLQTYVIDADDVRIQRRLAPADRASDLARLVTSLSAHPWVSRTVGCRFFRAYSRQFPRGEVDWKWLWRDSVRRSLRLIERKHRRREPVL